MEQLVEAHSTNFVGLISRALSICPLDERSFGRRETHVAGRGNRTKQFNVARMSITEFVYHGPFGQPKNLLFKANKMDTPCKQIVGNDDRNLIRFGLVKRKFHSKYTLAWSNENKNQNRKEVQTMTKIEHFSANTPEGSWIHPMVIVFKVFNNLSYVKSN